MKAIKRQEFKIRFVKLDCMTIYQLRVCSVDSWRTNITVFSPKTDLGHVKLMF